MGDRFSIDDSQDDNSVSSDSDTTSSLVTSYDEDSIQMPRMNVSEAFFKHRLAKRSLRKTSIKITASKFALKKPQMVFEPKGMESFAKLTLVKFDTAYQSSHEEEKLCSFFDHVT